MPIYAYQCPAGHRVERLRGMDHRHDPLACESDGCGAQMALVIARSHCAPDGVYSYAPNIGDADRFERQRQAIKDGTKVLPRTPDIPRDHRDGQLSPRRP